MNSEHADSIPHEFIDATISVKGLETPADEQNLHEMLGKTAGVKALTIASGKVTLEYDPMLTTKAQLGEAIARLGYRVEDVASAPASPISDALHGQPS